MSIKKTVSVNTVTIAYDFGITIATDVMEVALELDVVSCVVDGQEAIVRYSITANGASSDVTRSLKFSYSGGDINEEAKTALLASSLV